MHVMADLVREDVRLREVAGRVETDGGLAEEAEVEVDAAIDSAVEGPGRGRGRAARGRERAAEHDDRRGDVAAVAAPELASPEALDVGYDEGQEADRRRAWIRCAADVPAVPREPPPGNRSNGSPYHECDRPSSAVTSTIAAAAIVTAPSAGTRTERLTSTRGR
jgi:hypothetical protein